MGDSRSAKRHKWRIPCELSFEGGRQRSFVIDLSEGGLFVQTGVKLRPGSLVEIRFTLESVREPLLLRARVARAKQVPAQLTSIAHGGVGLQILEPPTSYVEAVRSLVEGEVLRAQSAAKGNAASGAPSAPARSVTRFRVRVQQCDGPRSRTLELAAESAEQARALALREVGAGWEAIAADRLAS